MEREFKMIQEKNLALRKEQVENLLKNGWMIIKSTYVGDGWVEYIFFKDIF